MNPLIQAMNADWKILEHTGLSIALRFRSPLEGSIIHRGVDRLSTGMPRLTESSYDEQKGVFTLRNAETETERQIYIKVRESRLIELTWGFSAEIDLDAIDAFWGAVADGFELVPVNISFIDYLWHVATDCPVQHYTAIAEAFFVDQGIPRVFGTDRIARDDLALSGLVDEHRVCTILVESDLTEAELRMRDFSNVHLKIRAGVGQTRGLRSDVSLIEQFRAHYETASTFLSEQVRPHIHDKLDAALARLRDANDRNSDGN